MESEESVAGPTAGHAPDQTKDVDRAATRPEPAAAASGEPSKPGDEFLQDWPKRASGDQSEVGLFTDSAKGEERRDAPIQADGAGKASRVTADRPAPEAGDGENRRGATPEPGRPEEARDGGAGEVPSVEELLSRVDRVIAKRAQRGPDAQPAAGADESAAGAPRKPPLSRLARALRLSRKPPSEKDSRRIVVR
jgi:hypothetical protein